MASDVRGGRRRWGWAARQLCSQRPPRGASRGEGFGRHNCTRLGVGPAARALKPPSPRPPARAGVLRRVLLLLVVLTVFGVGLFYLGLEYVLKVPEL